MCLCYMLGITLYQLWCNLESYLTNKPTCFPIGGLSSNLSNLCLVTSCSNASKFWEKDKLPLGQSDKKTCILTFWSAHGKLHLLEWDLFAHFRCRIPDEMFAQNEMHLTKKSLWNFPTGRTRRSQKLTHNLCKEQFMHQMRF